MSLMRLSLIVKTAKKQGNSSTAPSNARNSLVKLPEFKINNFSTTAPTILLFSTFKINFRQLCPAYKVLPLLLN